MVPRKLEIGHPEVRIHRGDFNEGPVPVSLSIKTLGRSGMVSPPPVTLMPASQSKPSRPSGRRLLGIDSDAAVVPFLTESLSSADVRVRLAVVGALGRLGGHQAITALEHALEDEHASIREAAETALEGLRKRGD